MAPMNNQPYRSDQPRRPRGQIVQQEAFQFSRVALINPDGSYYMQWQAGWQWRTTDSRFLPPAASINPMLPVEQLTPRSLSVPWWVAGSWMQPVLPGQQAKQWLTWRENPALPEPKPGLLRRLLGGGS
jgi:hypothetical protein